jgi:hypothetical protein
MRYWKRKPWYSLLQKPEEKPRHRWEDDGKMDLEGTVCGD